MTVTYDPTHHRSPLMSPMTRLICHLCRELTHPRLHSETRSSGIIRLVASAPRLLVSGGFRLEPCLAAEASSVAHYLFPLPLPRLTVSASAQGVTDPGVRCCDSPRPAKPAAS